MNPELADDLLLSVKNIATWMGIPARQVFYMAETGHLPLFKMGGKWAGRKSTLTQHITRLEEASLVVQSQKTKLAKIR